MALLIVANFGPRFAPAAETAPVAPATSSQTSAVTAPRAASVPEKKENFHIYLLMGQSNMVGRDTRTLAQQVDNEHVIALSGDNQWVVAHEPIHIRGTGVGPGIPFALAMLKANPGITIGLVPCAVGGTSLNHWVKGGDLYERAVARAKVAAESGVIKGVLWHQGESDSDSQKNALRYGRRLAQMFGDLRSALNFPNLPIVVGQLGEFVSPEKHPFVNEVRAAIDDTAKTVPHTGEALSNDLKDKGDSLHFSAEAQLVMGLRFAEAMQRLQVEKP